MSERTRVPPPNLGFASYFERLGKDSCAVGCLLTLNCVFDGEDVFAALLSTFEVGTTAFRFLRIKLDSVLDAADSLRRN